MPSKNVVGLKNEKCEKRPGTSREGIHMKRKYCKRGANLSFIATYMYNNFGTGSTDIRRALCKERDKEYSRGMYTCYFSEMPPWKPTYKNRFWTKNNNGWYLTLQGMGLVMLAGERE